MSIDAPIFGIDVHPQYQRGFDFDRADSLGYEFAFVKVSEGPYRDGTVWGHPELEAFVRRAQETGMLVGYYHFLVESYAGDPDRSGRAQAELFWRRVQKLGGAKGRLLCVDFEAYAAPHAYLTPSNATLGAFNRRLNELSGGHPLVLYSGPGFWNGGDSSGDFDGYGADVLWEARYPHMGIMPEPRREYQTIKDWGWDGFGGEKPEFWQFTAAGAVAGRNIDVNAYRRTMADLRSLAATPLPNEDEDHGLASEPDPSPSGSLQKNIQIVSAYGNALADADIEYWCWDGGNLNTPRPSVGRPASVDGPAPDPRKVRRGFCADLVSWQLRKLGRPIPKNRFGNENYDGGTRAFRLRYAKQMVPFSSKNVRKGGAAFVDFQTRWAPEGHIMFFDGDGPEAPALQSHLETSCGVGEPGFNRRHTVAESHGNGYYTHIIPAHVLWGDAKIRLN